MKNLQGLETLLELDDIIIAQTAGYWVRFEVRQVSASKHIPHGIRYNLTLHDNCNQRVMGYDNAHVPKGAKRGKYKAQIMTYDHKHQTLKCKGEPYSFNSPAQLIEDFWKSVDDYLKEHGII